MKCDICNKSSCGYEIEGKRYCQLCLKQTASKCINDMETYLKQNSIIEEQVLHDYLTNINIVLKMILKII